MKMYVQQITCKWDAYHLNFRVNYNEPKQQPVNIEIIFALFCRFQIESHAQTYHVTQVTEFPANLSDSDRDQDRCAPVAHRSSHQ